MSIIPSGLRPSFRRTPTPRPSGGRGFSRVVRQLDYWIEDHATAVVFTAWVLFIASVGVLLAWKTAKIIHLAGEFGPVLAIVSIVTGGALALRRILRARRDKRVSEAVLAPPPVAPANPSDG